MRLVKQSILYFKEGNSDKIYEIDLCDVDNDKYVVNFRYGRRYSKLKEGSKLPIPVSLAEAEKLYNENIFNKVAVHPAVHGFALERAIISNAQPHIGKAVVVNIDVKEFFPSIHYKMVKPAQGAIFQHQINLLLQTNRLQYPVTETTTPKKNDQISPAQNNTDTPKKDDDKPWWNVV